MAAAGTVEISGSGNADINVTGDLDVDVSGSGSGSTSAIRASLPRYRDRVTSSDVERCVNGHHGYWQVREFSPGAT